MQTTEQTPVEIQPAATGASPEDLQPLPPTETRRFETSDGFTATMETWKLENRDIVKVTPDSIAISNDGRPQIPLVVALGIHGDQRLHWALSAFAQEYEGSTVGILYRKPQGTARLTKTDRLDHPVPELEANQANDLIAALDNLGITRANAVTESRGNTRVEIAAAKRPDLFEHRYHAAPVGHDGKGYIGTHMSSLRIGRHGVRLRRTGDIDPLARELAAMAIPGEAPRHSILARRREQKAVARAHHAGLTAIAASTQYAPEQSVTYAGDSGDPGVKAWRLHRRIKPIQESGNGVQYVETHWGRHGFGQSRRPVREISQHFKGVKISK